MSDVKRYAAVTEDGNPGWSKPTEEGEFVLWDDYEALRDENKMLLSGSAEAAVVRQSRITELEAEVKTWEALFDKTPKHPKGILGNEFTSVHNTCKMAWEAEVEALRQKVADAESFYKSRRKDADDWWAERRYFCQRDINEGSNPDDKRTAREASDE